MTPVLQGPWGRGVQQGGRGKCWAECRAHSGHRTRATPWACHVGPTLVQWEHSGAPSGWQVWAGVCVPGSRGGDRFWAWMTGRRHQVWLVQGEPEGRHGAQPHGTPPICSQTQAPHWVLCTPPLPREGAPGCPTARVGTCLVLCPVFSSTVPQPMAGYPLPCPLAPGRPHLLTGGGQLVGFRRQHHQVVDDALQVGDLSQHGQLAVLGKQRVRPTGPAPAPPHPGGTGLPCFSPLPQHCSGLIEAGTGHPGASVTICPDQISAP